MKRSLALLAFATLLALLLCPAAAQQAPVPAQPLPARVGPPPKDASAEELESQGDKLRAAKAFADALDYYRAALKHATAGLWNKIGITEIQMGRYKDARKSFDHAIKLDRNFAEAYNNRGALYYILGSQKQMESSHPGRDLPRGARKNYRKAVTEYAKAVQLNGTVATYHSNLGTAYFALREFPAAANEYYAALLLDPNVFERHPSSGIAAQLSSPEDRAHYSFVLARMYAKIGNLDRALEYLRRAMEDGYQDIDAVYKDQEFATLRKDPRFTELMNRKPQAIPQ
jgi:tetratricopeptide (TPR) repeat protein